MKKILILFGVMITSLVLLVLFNTINFGASAAATVDDVTITLGRVGIADRLAGALRFKTISHQNVADNDYTELLGLHRYMEAEFPLVHEILSKEVVNEYSLLYKWKGSNDALKPAILLSHLDVVPVVPGTEDQWDQPPFSGKIKDGLIWGRGAIDDKYSVFSILEAVEQLISKGYMPERTYYLAFGHDEETGGRDGAKAMGELLAERGVQALYAIDEGGMIVKSAFGLNKSIALINISEKGFLSLQLSVVGSGGHSSSPDAETAVAILSRAVTQVSDNKFPVNIDALNDMAFAVASELTFPQKMVAANLWLLKPLMEIYGERVPALNSMIRTTTAPTMLSGSPKDNVLPILATAVVNHRIMPGETIESVMGFVRDVIDDERVKVDILGESNNPSEVSSLGPAFQMIRSTIQQVSLDDPVTVPGMLPAGTDTKHYKQVADDTYRFFYAVLESNDMGRAHGTNERVAVNAYLESIKFYILLFKNSDEITDD